MKEEIRQAYGSRLIPGFLPGCRLYRSEVGVSSNFVDVLPDTVTMRKDLTPVFSMNTGRPRVHTPFVEVGIVPFEEATPDDALALADNPPALRVRAKTIRHLFRALLRSVETSWEPDKFHFVMHSSGHDSRLLSWAIKYLYEIKGPDWLGDVLFVEWDGESVPFKQIMETEGWTDSQWAVYNPEAIGTEEYHAESVEFASAWKRSSGLVSIPLSLWYTPVVHLQQRGLVPKDDKLQCWTGVFANEIPKYTAWYGSLLEALCRIQDNPQCVTTQKGDLVWPFLNLDWIAAKHAFGSQFGAHQQKIMEGVTSELTHIPRIHSSTIKRGPYRHISERLFEKAKQDFNRSWYARNARLTPYFVSSRSLEYCSWWGHWGLASLCEHLLEQGYRIKV